LGWEYLFHVKVDDVWALGAVVPAILTAAVQPIQLGCASVLAGDEDFRRLSAIKFAHGISRGLLGASVASATGSLTQLLWVQAILDCVQVLVLLWFSLPQKGATHPKRQPLKLIGRSIVGQSATNFINSWLADAEKFAIGITGRTLMLASYNVPANAVGRLSAFGGSIAGVLMPRMAMLQAQKKDQEMSGLLGAGTRLNVWAMAVGSAPLIAFAPEWLTLWLGPAVAKTAAIPVQVLLVGAVANAAAVVANATIRATMRSRVLSSLYVIEVALHVVVVAVCVSTWGLIGAALAWSVRVLFDSVAHQVLIRSLTHLHLDWRWLLVVASSAGLVSLVMHYQSPVARVGFCVVAVVFASLTLFRFADLSLLRRSPPAA
jgi:O-antigen/teichoic acid export membrane protein